MLAEKRNLHGAKRFFRKKLKDESLFPPDKVGIDGAGTFPPAIKDSIEKKLFKSEPVHYATKHLQQRIESDHFRARRTCRGLDDSKLTTLYNEVSPGLVPCSC